MQQSILRADSPSSLPKFGKKLEDKQEAKYSQDMVSGISSAVDEKEEGELDETDLLLELQWQEALLQLATFEVEVKVDNSRSIDRDVFNKFSVSEKITCLKLLQHRNIHAIRNIFKVKTKSLPQISTSIAFFKPVSEKEKDKKSIIKVPTTELHQRLLPKLQVVWVQEKIKELCFVEPGAKKLETQIRSISRLLCKLKLSLGTLECFFTKLTRVRNRCQRKNSDFTLSEIQKLLIHIRERATVSPAVFISLLLNQEFDSIVTLHRLIDLFTLQEQLRQKKLPLSDEHINSLAGYWNWILQKEPDAFACLREINEKHVEEKTVASIASAFEVIQDYSLSILQENVVRIFTSDIPIIKWKQSLRALALEQLFSRPSKVLTRQEIVAQYQPNKPMEDDDKKLEHKRSDAINLEQQLEKIADLHDNDLLVSGNEKKLADWTKEDIQAWASRIKSRRTVGLNEVIAIMGRAAILIYGGEKNLPVIEFNLEEKKLEKKEEFSLRDTQRLALIVFSSSDTHKCLAEIKTGEGKTLIVTMLATYRALLGEKVDVVTSSSELAKRDADKQQEFYEYFRLTAAHNIVTKYEEIKQAYRHPILYGDASHYQADLLRERFLKQPTREGRHCETVIVDEVDSMLLDQGNDSTRLTEPFPGIHHLNHVLAFIGRQLIEADKALGNELANIEEEKISQQIYAAVMTFSGMRWYTDQDILTYVRFKIIQDAGGFANDRNWLLKNKQHDYYVIVLAACAESASQMEAPGIDYFFNKDMQAAPENKEKDDRYDVFDELKDLLLSQSTFKSKILFPYNIQGNHWILAEICLEKQEAKNEAKCSYKVEVMGHNPYGGGKISEQEFEKLSSAIQDRLIKLNPHLRDFIAITNKESPYTSARQATKDQNSCGVIVAEELLKRINDETLLRSAGCYPVGCREVRDAQRELIKNEYQLQVGQNPLDPAIKTIYCYQQSENSQNVWWYRINTQAGKIFANDEEKMAGTGKRLTLILESLEERNQVDDEERYHLVATLLDKIQDHHHKKEKRHFVENNKVAYRIPTYLYDLFLNELPHWIESALQANYRMSLGVEYRINNKNEILPIDHCSTGVTQENTQWERGLHQFLQLKHQVPITPLSLSTNFLAVTHYFLGYKKIFGLTGTLGSESQQTFLKKIYGVDCVFLPTFRQRRLIQLAPIILATTEDWQQRIVSSSLREAQGGRAVLLVCSSNLAARKLREALSAAIKPVDNIRIKEYTDEKDEEHKRIIGEIAKAGDIIVATNLAGRGTDIGISIEVESHCGLHTCVTFLPKNGRTLEQVAGRGGRKGQPGTWQMILDKTVLLETGYKHVDEITALLRERDTGEKNDLELLQNQQYAINTIKEKLFNQFCVFLDSQRDSLSRDAKENSLKEEIVKIQLRGIKERWAIWLQLHFQEEEWLLFPVEHLQNQLRNIEIEYSTFEKAIQRDIGTHNLFYNPYLMILMGNAYITLGNSLRDQQRNEANGYYDQAIDYMQTARKTDSACSWLAYHNEAFAHAAKSDKAQLQAGKIYELPVADEEEKKASSSSTATSTSTMTSSSTVSSTSSSQETKSESKATTKAYQDAKDDSLKKAQECLSAAKTHIEKQILPSLQSIIGLVYPEVNFNLVLVNTRPLDEQVKRFPSQIWLYRESNYWRYCFCKDIVQETLANGVITDEKMIPMVARWCSQKNEQKESETIRSSLPPTVIATEKHKTDEESIIQYIVAEAKITTTRDKTPLLVAKNQEIMLYHDLTAKMGDALKKLGEYEQIKISWHSLQVDGQPLQLELARLGYNGCIDIEKYTPPRFMWEALVVGLIGIAQIVAGAICIATGVGATVGMGLIGEGVGDILFAIEAGITGEFSWEAYGIQKAISMAVSLATAAASAIARFAGRLVKTGLAVAKASKVGQKVGAALVKVKNVMTTATKPLRHGARTIKDKVSKLRGIKVGQESFVKKTVLQQAEKSTVTILKVVGKELVEQSSIRLLSFTVESAAVKPSMEELRKLIKAEILEKLGGEIVFINNLHRVMGYVTYFRSAEYEEELYQCFTRNFQDSASGWQCALNSGLRQWSEGVASTLMKAKPGEKGVSTLIKTGVTRAVRLSWSALQISKAVQDLDSVIDVIKKEVGIIVSKGAQEALSTQSLQQEEYLEYVSAIRNLPQKNDLTADEKAKHDKQLEALEQVYIELGALQLLDEKNFITVQTSGEDIAPEDWNKIKDKVIPQQGDNKDDKLDDFNKEILISILRQLKKMKNKGLELIEQNDSRKQESVLDYLATLATEKIISVISQETMRHINYVSGRITRHISNKFGGRELAQNIKELARSNKPAWCTNIGLFSRGLNRKLKDRETSASYKHLLQKTQGNTGTPCRGNVLHVLVLGEDHDFTVEIYDENQQLILYVPGKDLTLSPNPLRLQYDKRDKGHYSYLQLCQGKLTPREFPGIEKNNCLFACIDHHLTGDEPDAGNIKELRKEAATHLEMHSARYFKPYCAALSRSKSDLLKGGTAHKGKRTQNIPKKQNIKKTRKAQQNSKGEGYLQEGSDGEAVRTKNRPQNQSTPSTQGKIAERIKKLEQELINRGINVSNDDIFQNLHDFVERVGSSSNGQFPLKAEGMAICHGIAISTIADDIVAIINNSQSNTQIKDIRVKTAEDFISLTDTMFSTDEEGSRNRKLAQTAIEILQSNESLKIKLQSANTLLSRLNCASRNLLPGNSNMNSTIKEYYDPPIFARVKGGGFHVTYKSEKIRIAAKKLADTLGQPPSVPKKLDQDIISSTAGKIPCNSNFSIFNSPPSPSNSTAAPNPSSSSFTHNPMRGN